MYDDGNNKTDDFPTALKPSYFCALSSSSASISFRQSRTIFDPSPSPRLHKVMPISKIHSTYKRRYESATNGRLIPRPNLYGYRAFAVYGFPGWFREIAGGIGIFVACAMNIEYGIPEIVIITR